MNILISAHHCSPYEGSECAVGWNWLYQYSRNAKSDDHIYVITLNIYADSMRRAVKEYRLNNVIFYALETPGYLDWLRNKHKLLYPIYYPIWQRYAYRYIQKKGVVFDIIHHVSKVDWRFTGSFSKDRNSYTIFGPVGGGQEIPRPLRQYQTNKVIEIIRSVGNRTRKILPGYRKAIKAFDAIYAVNEETKHYIEEIVNCNVKIETDIATPEQFRHLQIEKKSEHKQCRFLFSGNYNSPRKGAAFLLDSLEYLPDNFDYTIDFVGGRNNAELEKKVKELRLDERIDFLGRMSYSEMKNVYVKYDAFLFTSIRETSGNVLFEAMASGLPVVGFNTSINRTLKENSCGIFIEVRDSLENIKKSFAKAMVKIFEENNHSYYANNAYSFANEHTWGKKYNRIIEDFHLSRDAKK